MRCLDELPLPALLLILELAEDGFCADPLAKKTALHAPRLWKLAAVSQSWARAVRALLESLQDTNVTLNLQVFSATSTAGNDARCGGDSSEIMPLSAPSSAVKRVPPKYAIRVAQPEPTTSSWLLARILRGLLSFIYSPEPQRQLQDQRRRNQEKEKRSAVINHENELDAEYVVINTSATLASEVVRFQRTLAHKQALGLKISWPTSENSDMNEDVALDWGIVFSQCTKLQRLDLSDFPIMSSQLIAILLAASTHCKAVKVLVMPQQDCLGYVKRDIMPVFEAMYAALSKWQQQSLRAPLRHSGLHKLMLPKLYPYEYSDEHMANITVHCPALDYIEGLRLAPIFPNSRQTNEQVLESWISAWREFCRACPSIREFSWLDLPFIDDLFVLFAAEPKLAMESMTLPGNTALWKRDYLFRERQAATSFLCTPEGTRSVLRACPSLLKLKVVFSDRQVTFGNEDQLVVDDAFLQELARSCHDLQELRLVESSAHHGFDITNTVTDIGLSALASLPSLRHVEINGVDCTAEGLLTLMSSPCSVKVPQRSVNVTIGGRGSQKFNLPAKFNHLVEDFLLLALDQGLDRQHMWPRFSITFRIDSCNQQLPILWESSYLPKWRQLKQRLDRKLPQLQFSYDLVHEIKVRWIPSPKQS